MSAFTRSANKTTREAGPSWSANKRTCVGTVFAYLTKFCTFYKLFNIKPTKY